ncbi:hypothetical protein BO86DRAFT_171572 [Aspergillus japonicus CBS 114.51]|uniref:Aspergillopepsin n=2 Tax=Aspergillus TaxID=5052 RepID=A0A2V5H919_ASPV1|nr:hypothetical protein BO86DRAFT_171572 [Aspergillus japonicus CBS 114.51]PYI20809.1 hypothetical protein BO99DRAFT_102330 [Aspergillus violaceofuscus CBS 115571]RAH78965.1 hypothetical protein BO86DRAFT_171572 [Aspergillus japonicus CBS 114.51]
MKLLAPILATTCLASSVLAAPRSGLVERMQARFMARGSRPLQPHPSGSDPKSNHREEVASSPDTSHVTYSSNWAGIVREEPPTSGPYTAVSATFQVPKPTAAANSRGTQAGSAWVGIDGDTYSAAILQTGVDFYVQNGKVSGDAWYEWYPDYAYDFDLTVSPGDTIVAKVQSLSPSQGVAIIENKSTGQKATQTVSAPEATATLAGQNADWIVEDFQAGDEQVALTDFGTVTFTGAQAQGGGQTVGVQDGTVIELKQNNQVLTEVDVQSDTKFSVTYIG